MWKRVLLSILLLAGLSPLTFALAETPPDGLDDTLENMVERGFVTSHNTRGWGSVYDLPQSQFSIDDVDFFDNSNEFGKIGLYIIGMDTLLNPQLAGLDLNDGLSSKITHVATKTLPWVWTPNTETFGTGHKEKLPNNGIANVLPSILGINATSNACMKDESIAFNTWGVPKDTINKQTQAQLSTLAGAGYLFLRAADFDSTRKNDYMKIATGIGNMLLDAIVVEEGESFGIPASKTADTYGHTIPVGLMPYQFIIQTDSADTELCTDGGNIKLHESRKTHMAQTILFWDSLAKETGDTKYSRAARIAEKGMLALQECDGTYKDYMRWEGAGINPNNCTPDDGSAAYEAYPAYVAVGETKGFITDMSVTLHLLQKSNPKIYTENTNFKKAVQSLLVLEEDDAGSGLSRNGDLLKYASYSIDTEGRAFAQLMLGHVFLRASCVESEETMERRLQQQAYALFDKADNFFPSELDGKIANALASDPNNNILAVSAAADAWKIITVGCEECVDNDGDGYIDGVCAKDTVKFDCNDSDAAVHPGASEVCDAVDNDCDGKVDNGFDEDDDGVSTCAIPKDCNDNSDKIYPGATENEDNLDNDCNGKIDDAGIEVQLNNVDNSGIGSVEIVFIEYGNVCAGSFASLANNIPQIKNQCATVGTCTTDANGYCLFDIAEAGKYQALANIPQRGIASEAVTYAPGNNVQIYMQATSAVDLNSDVNASGKPNPFTSNPYFLAGFIIVGLIVGGGILFYLVKTGKVKLALPTISNKSPVRVETSASKPSLKLPAFKLPSLPKPAPKSEKKESSMLVSGKMSASQKIASKIIGGAPIGSKLEQKLREKKPINFAKKENAPTKKKIWKDD